MSRILWTLPYMPWPVTSGGKARQFHLMSHMAKRGHAITLLVQSKNPVDDEARAAMAPLVEKLIVLPRRPLRSARTLWAAATSSLPLLASVNSFSPALEQAFDRLLDEPWDVIHIEHSYCAQPFLDVLSRRARPFVVSEHNVESLLHGATYGKWPAMARPFAAYDRVRSRRWEQKVLRRAERIIGVTREDALALNLIGGRPADVVSNGVEVSAFAEVRPEVESARLLFIGNFEYAPNVDAVEWTVADIMPLVWARRPEARLIVCGHALPERWRLAHADPRIEWHGYVPRLQDVQQSSAMFIAALRHGGGSKLKVLEAMAAGLPLVSTRQGVSGLAAIDGTDALVADDARGLADRLCDLLADPALARRIGEAGRARVREGHDWSVAADELEAAYARFAGAATPLKESSV